MLLQPTRHEITQFRLHTKESKLLLAFRIAGCSSCKDIFPTTFIFIMKLAHFAV